MARWSILKDGSASVEIVQNRKNNGFLFDIDPPVKGGGVDDCKDRLRSLFDQVLSRFLREVSANKYICPIPALLGDGRPADLFKLFWTVRKSGGYDAVSKNGLWGFVAKECGLGVGVMAAIKLIYVKYLNELDQWFRQVFRDKSVGNIESGVVEKLDLLSLELEEFKGSLSSCQHKKNDSKLVHLESSKNGFYIDLDINASELNLSASELHLSASEKSNNVEISNNDDDEKFPVQDDNSIMLSAKSIVEKAINSRKRKRESSLLSEMLNWVTQAAKHHDNPAIGKIPDCSKWKEHGSEELWVQALLARDALLVRRHVDSDTEESLLQKKIRMHPSMYEDNDLNRKSTERLRCSERLPMAKSQLCPCCNSCPATQSKLACPRNVEVKTIPKEPSPTTVEILTTNTTDDNFEDDPLRKQVFVGPLFQAEIPSWTGVVSESDSKWLGTRMWPPDDEADKPLVERNPIGKGRQNNPCTCNLPGSTECVRFHIAEKRMRLKLELGLLFYRWRYDRMGEEVSLSWTIEEEKRFKDMVRLHHASPKKLWNNVFGFFPTKTRAELVSYYFNVLLVRRRSYQNRVTPKNIDSDDDETEFGSIGGSFGYEAINASDSKLRTCSQNTQCTDLE